MPLSITCFVYLLPESQSILAKIGAEAFCRASKDFPPAALCEDEFMEGRSTDVDGRSVVITFRRTRSKRHNATWFAWNLHPARYADGASEVGAT